MSHTKGFFNRFIAFLLFLALALLAAWGIGHFLDQPYAETITSYANKPFWQGLADRANYPMLLLIAAIVSILLGLLFLLVNIERRRVGRQVSPTSEDYGVIRINPANVASAVEHNFSHLPGVSTSGAKAVEDRGVKLISVQVNAPADCDMRAVADACAQAGEDIRLALPGQEIHPRFLVKVDKAS